MQIQVFSITPLYAAALALLFVFLSIRVIGLRRSLKVPIGFDSQTQGGSVEDQQKFLRAIRAHANFSEYIPISLVLLACLELQSNSPVILHILGACLLLGRLLHSYGISFVKEKLILRVSGMVLTFSSIISMACILIYHALI
jgi:uncharacterized protein